MSGIVMELRVTAGTEVKQGDPVAVMSAMKMETVIAAPIAGKVTGVHVAASDSLRAGDLLMVIE